MISNPNLIYYACISKGPTILTEFSSEEEEGIESIGQKCIEKTPPYHSMFSHTVRKRTYTFLIDDPFAYFAIHHENLGKSESLWFLNRVKCCFEELILSNSVKDFDELTSLCFQSQFSPVFREIVMLDADFGGSRDSWNSTSVDSSIRGGATVVKPLLASPSNKALVKKKKRSLGCVGEANGDHQKDGGVLENKVMGENGNNNSNVVLCRDFSVSMMQKNGGFYTGDTRQKAKQIWRKHVWVVLILDLVVCAVLFGIWLWVCQGFKCIDG